MKKIFVSYRRADSKGFAHAIYNLLATHFGFDNVFMDVNTIPLGVDFASYLQNAVSECDILLALISSTWENIKDAEGKKRIFNPDDFVRIEISSALRFNKIVIPVLLDGTRMPQDENLPDDLKPLTRRNAFEIGNRLEQDVKYLIEAIDLKFPQQQNEKRAVDLNDDASDENDTKLNTYKAKQRVLTEKLDVLQTSFDVEDQPFYKLQLDEQIRILKGEIKETLEQIGLLSKHGKKKR